ncbi:MAG: sodium:solute symporter family protein [Agathobaculum sp.]|jgi:SSS family solute:Na+ symporter|uniref:sodium:solute symporter family protein n=1 Tax=Agathobaculum sp. TaxID=2048138 RepID=UPI003D89C0B1
MITLGLPHLIGAVLTLVLVFSAGIVSGRKVKSAADFATGGGKSNAIMVAGAIIGTLVGGSSTVATSQLAFTHGFSAIWFSLGGGLGCLLLGLFFVRPMRKSGYLTLQQMIQQEYGPRAGFYSSVLGSLGIFLNIVAQLLSAMALLAAIVPLSPLLCALIVAAMMMGYVVFGGMRGAGAIGLIKTVMLYACAILCVIIVFQKSGGPAALYEALPAGTYFNLFARGLGVDGGAALSLILGVLSTQTYAQSVLSAKSDRAAVQGALASAVLIPPIGLGGVLIGMYMQTAFPTMEAAQTFPQFILLYMPGFWAGVFLAVLLIAIIGCGAGLTLGISSIVTNNLYARAVPNSTDERRLTVNRIAIVAVLLLAVLFTVGDLQSVILQWSFMSMGLRGAVVFLPLCGALFLPGKIASAYGIAAIIAGPLCVLLGKLLLPGLPFDPLFLGMLLNLVIMAIGLVRGRRGRAE